MVGGDDVCCCLIGSATVPVWTSECLDVKVLFNTVFDWSEWDCPTRLILQGCFLTSTVHRAYSGSFRRLLQGVYWPHKERQYLNIYTCPLTTAGLFIIEYDAINHSFSAVHLAHSHKTTFKVVITIIDLVMQRSGYYCVNPSNLPHCLWNGTGRKLLSAEGNFSWLHHEGGAAEGAAGGAAAWAGGLRAGEEEAGQRDLPAGELLFIWSWKYRMRRGGFEKKRFFLMLPIPMADFTREILKLKEIL